MAEVYGGAARPPQRWGRRLLITLIVLLVLVGIIAGRGRTGSARRTPNG